jgi:excisionase family DNA binding protein
MGVMELLTVRETAALLKTSQQQVRKMIRAGLLPAVKIGREWRVSSNYLQDFLERNMI